MSVDQDSVPIDNTSILRINRPMIVGPAIRRVCRLSRVFQKPGNVIQRVLVNVEGEVPQEAIAEYEDEEHTGEVEDEIEKGVTSIVGDEYGLETETLGDSVNSALHELPQNTTNNGGNDTQVGVTATAARGDMNESAEDSCGKDMRKVVPPPRIVVEAEHAGERSNAWRLKTAQKSKCCSGKSRFT